MNGQEVGISEQPTPIENCVKEYRPSRMEALRDYRVEIEFLSVGCIIRVGCKSIPFQTVKEAMISLNEYIVNPVETRKIWEKIFSQEEYKLNKLN